MSTYVARIAGLARLPGLILTAGLALLAMSLANLAALKHVGLTALPLGILAGVVVGHTGFPRWATSAGPGVDAAKGPLLRLGIVLFGFRITFQQIGAVGVTGVLIDATMVALTFAAAMLIGTRLLKLDRHTAMLIGAGSAICGAAAVMATEPVVRCQPHKVSVAIATVVIFGTLSMFLYPLLFPHLGLSAQQFGVYAGSTIHEVAQVVAAGEGVGDVASQTAVIEKMLRVMMLAPFLLILSATLRKENSDCSGQARIIVPWFALLFIAASGVNSLGLISQAFTRLIAQVDIFVLAMAMAALGLRTHVSAVRRAGIKPLILAALLFCFLSVGGYAVNTVLTRWMS
jgi:uncharacterized integral membrane protein (TIGR00698 family)